VSEYSNNPVFRTYLSHIANAFKMTMLLICNVSAKPMQAGVGVTTSCLDNTTKKVKFSTTFQCGMRSYHTISILLKWCKPEKQFRDRIVLSYWRCFKVYAATAFKP